MEREIPEPETNWSLIVKQQDRAALIAVVNNLNNYRACIKTNPDDIASLLEIDIESLNRILWPEDFTQDTN